MNYLTHLLSTYGLWALFFGAFLEGDLTLILTGLLIHNDVWPADRALLVGAAGALAGDSFYFWLGHGTARRWLCTAHGQRVLPRIERMAQRYGLVSLFFARYFYGARMATMFFWGTRRLSVRKFLVLDTLNCLVWAISFGGLGYVFATSLEWLMGRIRLVESRLLLALLVFGIVLAVRNYLAELDRSREKRRCRAAAENGK